MNTVKLSIEDRNLLRKVVACVTKAINTSNEELIGLATESTLVGILNSETGLVTTGIESVTLPYSIPGDVYNSFTIITSGSVSIDSVTVPPGTYTYSCGSNETLTGKALADVSGGSVILLTTAK